MKYQVMIRTARPNQPLGEWQKLDNELDTLEEAKTRIMWHKDLDSRQPKGYYHYRILIVEDTHVPDIK